MKTVGVRLREGLASAREFAERLLKEAHAICEEDRQMCRAIGRHGARYCSDGQGVLTHCNAGGLATSDYGTALAVLFAAHEAGKRLHVFVDETRPLLQGSRLTAWELKQRGIDATLICDSMAAQVMREGRVQAVVVGADRIAANGDTANKIGTYGLARVGRGPRDSVLRRRADEYVRPVDRLRRANPDRAARSARNHARIRPADRARRHWRLQSGVRRHARALITAIVCERGVIRPVTRDTIRAMLS